MIHNFINIIIIIIGIQPWGRFGQRPELSQSTGIALVRCILGKFLGVVCHCFPPRLEVELWSRMFSGNFAEMTTSTPFRDLLHAANLRHGTDGFTSPPKEGVLRIFSFINMSHKICIKIEGMGKRGTRRKQPSDELKETHRYRKLKEVALVRTLWRTHFER